MVKPNGSLQQGDLGSTAKSAQGLLGPGFLGMSPEEISKLDPEVKKSLLQKLLGM
jgi:hypothetical protein